MSLIFLQKMSDIVFPNMDFRFIVLNSGVDTIHKDNEMLVILKNVMKAVSAQETLVVNVTQFIAGDRSPVNVVPDTATLRGTIRTHNNQLFREMQKKVGEIAAAVCAFKGCTCDYSCDGGYPAVINTEAETKLAWNAITEMGYHAVTAPANMGGEDFAYYLLEKPGCYLKLGVSNNSKGIAVLPHDCRFTLDEDAMLVGMRVFLSTYCKALEQN